MFLASISSASTTSKVKHDHTHVTHSLYSYRESLVGTLEAPRGVRQMNGVPQSGADWYATAESRVRAYWSNRFTVNETYACIFFMVIIFSIGRVCYQANT